MSSIRTEIAEIIGIQPVTQHCSHKNFRSKRFIALFNGFISQKAFSLTIADR